MTWLKSMMAGVMALTVQLSAIAEGPDTRDMLLRTVPLTVSSHAEAALLDQHVQTADDTMRFIETQPSLLLHMEVIRRAYGTYGTNPEEHAKLMSALKARYQADTNNAANFFDYGYAQLVMDGNKNGLFFLRKANDKLASPYTSLAYGLAQIDADRLMENVAPDVLSTRKMDAGYKLKDALMLNKQAVLPGVWPTYVSIMEALSTYPAFESLRFEDVTMLYVPYAGLSSASTGTESGNQFLAISTTTEPASNIDASKNSMVPVNAPPVATCTATTVSALPAGARLVYSRPYDLLGQKQSFSINFYQTQAGQPYTVQVTNPGNQVIAQFTSYKAPYITEDLEGDGKYELVIRQFEKDPHHPLYVYRWNGSTYCEDRSVSNLFR